MSNPNPDSTTETAANNETSPHQQQQSSASSQHIPAYPPPPPYYLYFPTSSSSEQDSSSSSNNNPFSSPPPPIHELLPSGEKYYQVFGAFYEMPLVKEGNENDGNVEIKRRERHTVRPGEQSIRELFGDGKEQQQGAEASKNLPPPTNKKHHLKRLLKSLIVNYISLLKILELNPMQKFKDVPEAHFFTNEGPGEKTSIQWKMQQIHLILTNMHYLLNLYRPVQARHQLKSMLERQKSEWENAAKKVTEFMEGYVGVIREKYGERLDAPFAVNESKLKQEGESNEEPTRPGMASKRKRDSSREEEPSEENFQQQQETTRHVTPSFMIPQNILNEFFGV